MRINTYSKDKPPKGRDKDQKQQVRHKSYRNKTPLKKGRYLGLKVSDIAATNALVHVQSSINYC